MRRSLILTAAAAACLCIGPAMAGTDAPTAKPNPNEIVCKSLPPPTGTRLGGRRVCMTRAQWDQAQVQAADAVRHQQELGKMGKLPGN